MNLLTTLLWTGLGLALLASVLFPKHGLVARARAWRLAAQREQVENALKHLLSAAHSGMPTNADALSGALGLSVRSRLSLLARMESQGLVHTAGSELRLTPEGERWALQIVRAHRLWERYLADEARLPLNQVHAEAHRREHGMSAEALEDLDDALGRPALDPHGDPIPDTSGKMRAGEGSTPLTAWPVGIPGRVTHLEDEPPVVYAQILAEGLRLGQVLHIVEARPERIVVSDGENEFHMAPIVAANISLAPLPAPREETAGAFRLSQLTTGARARIARLDDSCQGFTRRRFLDLGLTPGTEIRPELANAFREPRAYRVRGTLIALRQDQSGMIWVRPWMDDGRESGV